MWVPTNGGGGTNEGYEMGLMCILTKGGGGTSSSTKQTAPPSKIFAGGMQQTAVRARDRAERYGMRSRMAMT